MLTRLMRFVAIAALLAAAGAFTVPYIANLNSSSKTFPQIVLTPRPITITAVPAGTTKLKVLGTGETTNVTTPNTVGGSGGDAEGSGTASGSGGAAGGSSVAVETQIDVVTTHYSIVAALSETDVIIGLTVVTADELQDSYVIDEQTSALTLLMLSPQILDRDIAKSYELAQTFAQGEIFDALVRTLEDNGLDLRGQNSEVTAALAQVLTPITFPYTTQVQCDDSQADITAHLCLSYDNTATHITNHSDRSVVLYTDTTPHKLCAVLGPVGSADSQTTLTQKSCAKQALVIGPGTFERDSVQEQSFIAEISSATLIELYRNYVSPFADLTATSTGHNSQTHLVIDYSKDEILELLTSLSAQGQPLFESSHIGLVSTTTQQRNHAAITTARVLIDASISNPIIASRTGFDTDYLDLLNFYTATNMKIGETPSEWYYSVKAIELIQIGATSEGGS